MTKKRRTDKRAAGSRGLSFDPEKQPLFAYVAFAVIFVVLLILFSGFVFSDKMLFMSDQIEAGLFFRELVIESVTEHGAVPQWNPYIFCGMPYVEAFHGDIFYPLSFLKFFLSPFRWQGWTLFFHIFLGGIFMYLAARQFQLSKVAALMSGACYMFSAYLISLAAPGHDGKIYVTTLFPLLMLFLDKGLRSERFRQAFLWFSLLGLAIGVMILSPHPQMSYFALWALAFYTVFRLVVILHEFRSVVKLIRPSLLTVYAVIIGLLISAIQFYPGYSYTTDFSPRSDEKQGWIWATSWSMHEEEAFSLLIPEFSGTTSRNTETYYWGKNVFKDNSESPGAVAFFLALLGFAAYRRKESYFFGGLALFALIYALGATTPLFKIFYYLIPKVKSLRAPSIIMFLFSFSVAMLAGMGLQAFMEKRDQKTEGLSKGFRYLLFGFPGLLFVLAVLFIMDGRGMLSSWASLFYSEAATTFVQQGVSKLNVAYMNLPAIQLGAWLAFVFAALAALLIWLYRWRKQSVWILVALVALPVIDGVRFNRRFIHTADFRARFAPNPVTEYFKQHPGNYRVMNFTTNMIPEDFLMFFGTEVVMGYHGNQLRWYDNLVGGMAKSNLTNPRLLNLVGAEYILFPAEQELPGRYFGSKPVTVAADFGALKIWRNDNAYPRAYLVDQYLVFDSIDQVYDGVLRSGVDLRCTVLLEQQPTLEYQPDSLTADSAWVVYHEMDSVLVGVSCSANKILVLVDNFYESWHAFVDGTPAPTLRAYGSFRAVEIPAGSQQVKFVFRSEKYRIGKMATTLTSLYLLVIIGVSVYMDRRKQKVERTP